MFDSSLPAETADDIQFYADQPIQPVSLRQLYEYARVADEQTFIRAAQFLHREMPIRLARKVRELEHIPGGLWDNQWIRLVHDWYVKSFQEIASSPLPKRPADEQAFNKLLANIKYRHRNQVQVMARGIREYTDRQGPIEPGSEMQNFLDSFYLSRIGIRVLIGHHDASHQFREGWVGIICAQTSPIDVAKAAAEDAAAICRQTYGDPPPVRFDGRFNLRFKYIPSHLHHMLFELFKNSFRAVIEAHKDKGGSLPQVNVIVAGGMEDVSIRISDQGGGIPRSGIDRIWTYAYTTAKPTSMYLNDTEIMAGLGYGLPLSRLYARYFGGDLQVMSLEGYGTDAYLHLSRLGTHSEYIA